ncbi:MAG: histidine kinase [Chitinophagaceae bacterium]|nr:histidine kinase [Chitinophagaceae bacterium]
MYLVQAGSIKTKPMIGGKSNAGPFTINYRKYRLWGTPALSVLLYMVFTLINPMTDFFKEYENYTLTNYFAEIISVVFFAAVSIESGIIVSKILNQYMPWDVSPRRRMIVQLVLQVIIFAIFIVLLLMLANRYYGNFYSFAINLELSSEEYDNLIVRQAVILGIFVSILITTIFTGEYFFNHWVHARLEVVMQKSLVVQAQLEALKTQIDPHFLFNNFSTLTAIIEEDPALAVNYVQMLANVYRYMLANQKEQLASVESEIDFIRAYLFLYTMRYGNALKVEIDICDIYLSKRIPPMSLQLLMENAMKHNELSGAHPLNIVIKATENHLSVKNNLQPKRVKEPGLDMGLKNISERYRLLSAPVPEVSNANGSFEVKIPLL